jgi:hypothetical protein
MVGWADGTRGGSDGALYEQALSGVAALHPRVMDEAESTTRLALALVALAKENGLTQIDHVVVNPSGVDIRNGDNVFVVEGRLDDPAHRRAHMKTELALQMPIEVSAQRIEATNVENDRVQTRQIAEQDLGRTVMKP